MPAATGAALVISTPEALKFIRLAQELDCCAHAHVADANVDQNTSHSNCERIVRLAFSRRSLRGGLLRHQLFIAVACAKMGLEVRNVISEARAWLIGSSGNAASIAFARSAKPSLNSG